MQTVDLAKERVRIRVTEGGHNIENDIIERRYKKGINNLFNIYLPIVDGTMIFDNSLGNYELLAQKYINEELTIFNELKFSQLKSYHDNY